MNKIKENIIIIIGAIIGCISGYLYWKYVGCASGSCPITSSPIISTLYMGVLGGLIGSIVKNRNKK